MRGRVLVIAGITALAAAAPARAATYTVTGTADGTGSCTGTSCPTLRAAVTAANTAGGGNAIKLGAATYSLGSLGALTVTSQLTVAGASAASTAVSQDGKSGRVFIVSGAGKLTVRHATVSNGFAEAGGDIGGDIAVASGTQLVLDHVRVTGGKSLRGGGIAIQGGTSVTIDHSLVDNNQAVSLPGVTSGQGGGIFRIGNVKLAPSTLSITDSTVTGNTAATRGGIAVSANASDSTTLTRSTVAFNSAGSTDGGPGIDVAADGGRFTVTGSIIAGNTGDGVKLNCTGTLTSGGGNIDSDSSCGLATSTDRQNTDPVLGSLTPGLGETPVLPITAVSPAVDLTPIKDATCTGTDQRDLPRPQGGGCDAGAYEVDQAPDTTIDSGDSGTIATPSNTFTFSSTEPGVTFECKLDGPGTTTGVYDVCTSATGYGRLPDGAYTFSVRAVDGTGNTDPSPATRTFTVDTTPPDTSATGPSGATNNSSPSFSFTSPEATATFQCKLDGPGATTGSFGSCTSPKAYSALADGTYTFSVRALDAVGNADASPATRTFTVDTTGPDTSITSGSSGTIATGSASFGFASPDTGARFQCRLDGPGAAAGTFTACTSPKFYAGLGDGSYTFSVRAVDGTGNTDATPATRTFTVDTTPPKAAIVSGPSGETADTSPAFAFSAGEAGAALECRLDGPNGAVRAFGPCTSPKSFAGLAPGDYTFFVRARDAAGNSAVTSRSFTVEPPPPPPPPGGPAPEPHETVVVAPASGRTLIKLPGSRRFVPLDVTKGIPLGSVVDTRHSRVRLSAIRRAGQPLETALFYGGIFKVTQTSSVTQLRLVQRLSCAAPARKKAAASRKRVRKRRLWGNGHGRFRTRGQYSSATVRGTKWLVQDSCDTTLTRVARGIVAVRDLVRHRTIRVRAGHRYTARRR